MWQITKDLIGYCVTREKIIVKFLKFHEICMLRTLYYVIYVNFKALGQHILSKIPWNEYSFWVKILEKYFKNIQSFVTERRALYFISINMTNSCSNYFLLKIKISVSFALFSSFDKKIQLRINFSKVQKWKLNFWFKDSCKSL